MREWNYKKEDGKEVWKELEKAISYNSRNEVFNDWLDLIINSLLSLTDNMGRENLIEKFKQNKLDGKYNERYLEIAEKYSKGEKGSRPIDYLCSAWALLVKETQEKKKDILGDIYQEMITFGQHGQFFTPEHITDLMAKIVGVKDEKVYDPCCGSGRFLIAALKENPEAKVCGGDIDERCAKMAVINMWLFDAKNAEIKHGDTIGFKIWKTWRILKGGFIYETEN